MVETALDTHVSQSQSRAVHFSVHCTLARARKTALARFGVHTKSGDVPNKDIGLRGKPRIVLLWLYVFKNSKEIMVEGRQQVLQRGFTAAKRSWIAAPASQVSVWTAS